MASYPAAPVVFPARSDGQTVFAQHMNAVQDEITAIEASLVGGTLPNPQRIVGTRPTLILDGGGTAKTRVWDWANFGAYFSINLGTDGTVYNLDDIAKAGTLLTLGQPGGTLGLLVATPGANPRTLAQMLAVPSDGSIRERGRAFGMGEWQPIAFNAGDYVGTGTMTWTVAAAAMFKYALVGKACTVMFDVTGAIGGTVPSGAACRITLPASLMPAGGAGSQLVAPIWLQAGTASTTTIIGVAVITGGTARIDCYSVPNTVGVAGYITGQNARVNGSVTFAIN